MNRISEFESILKELPEKLEGNRAAAPEEKSYTAIPIPTPDAKNGSET